MAIKIGSNIASIQAQRRLGEATASLGKIYEQLSSGQRINRASDDAAGLAISSTLNANARIYSVASRNVADTISAVSIASDATKALSDISTRQRELSTQSANGTFSSTQRDALDKEAKELTNEYNRIISTTSFNGQKLLANPWETLSTQLGIGNDAIISFKFADALSTKLSASSYFILDGVEDNYVWFTLDGAGSDPAPFDSSKGIQVDLSSTPGGSGALTYGPTADEVAQAVGAALTASGRYTTQTGTSQGELIVTNLIAGRSTLTGDVSTGIVLTDVINPGTGQDVYAVGVAPWGESTLSDLNGDGRPDIVQSNSGGSISVLLNQGDGSFAAAIHYTEEGGPYGAATVSDLNGDGRPDIVQSNSGGTVSVLLNQGNGTFGAATDYVGAYGARDSATVSDLNGDGRPDIVQSSGSNNSVTVLLNQGDGTFGAKTDYTVAQGSLGAATLSDLDGDGSLDIVISNYAGNAVSVLINNGNGTFPAAATDYVVGGDSYGAAAASDLNGDGRPDIVVSNINSNTVSVLINNGNGTFPAATDYAVGFYPTSAATLSDLDGNGSLDIVMSNYLGDTVSVLLNQGDGTFAAATDYAVGPLPYGAATLSDLNGDGRPDIAQSNSGDGTVSVLLNQGNGTFGVATPYMVGSSIKAATLSDLNGDGRPDIVQSNSGGSVSVLLNQGNGTFESNPTYAVTRLIFGDARGMTQVDQIDLTTQGSARHAMDTLDSRLERLSAQQGAFGSIESRLAAAANIISTSRENFLAAESRIKDVDMAEESANLVRTQIVQQAAAAVLAQANQQPSLALSLLRG